MCVLFERGDYSRVATIRGGGDYLRAASNRRNIVHKIFSQLPHGAMYVL